MEFCFQSVKEVMAKHFSDLLSDDLDARTEKLLRWCEDEQVFILAPHQFPSLLQEIADPPPWLFVRGDLAALGALVPLALVGTRRPSPYGLRAAHHFAHEAAAAGFTLVSGLARGIDGVAHSAAVLKRQPTVAVLGHGLDRLYPTQHRALARDLLACGGCLVSEYPPGVGVQPFHFPRRNRILSGLSYGVLVVEAGEKSGSLITARHALEQNREVFVVPGPFFEKSFEGSHWLLRQGAKVVTRISDITEEWAPGVLPLEPCPPPADENGLRSFMKTRGVASLEEILAQTGEPLPRLRQALETAREQGWVVESGPQKFVYAGR